MSEISPLFRDRDEAPVESRLPTARAVQHTWDSSGPPQILGFGPDEHLLEIYEHSSDPYNASELRDLYLGRVEAALGSRSMRPDLADQWKSSRHQRVVSVEEVLSSRATPQLVKSLFNFYFRDDLYGPNRNPEHLILSSGSVDELEWGMPSTLKQCIGYALDRDWYGYSDSRGREPAREAVAAYESARMPSGSEYNTENIALTMGATFAVGALADHILSGVNARSPALCAIPNYPPLVASVAHRASTILVPTPSIDGRTSLRPLIEAIRPQTPLVLLQTAANPTGSLVDEGELAELITSASPETIVILDECHEWLGTSTQFCEARSRDNVVRVNSLSKNWSAPGMKIGWIVASAAFIDNYYEYASSNYGGPPSLFSTAIEVLARMERWRHEGRFSLRRTELCEFDHQYGLTLAGLQHEYSVYLDDRSTRENELLELRRLAASRLELPNTEVVSPHYSINLAVDFAAYDDGYLAFRQILDATGVAVFPGLLTFCMAGGFVRVTTARNRKVLNMALDRIQAHAFRL